jgi:hypothetical protein
MPQNPIFSGDIDPDIAALIGGGKIQEMEVKGRKAPTPAVDQDSPDFNSLFGDLDLTGGEKKGPTSSIDLSKKHFAPLPRTEDNPPNQYFTNPDFYKIALNGSGEEAQTFHQVFSRYLQTTDPKDKGIMRQKVIPAYWNLLNRYTLQCVSRDFPVPKQVAMRFGAILPNLITPEQKSTLERVVLKNETGEPIYYIDEWIRALAVGQIKASATDEVKVSRMDDKTKTSNAIAKAQGKRDSSEAILKAKAEERRVIEGRIKEKVDFITNHNSRPGLIHITEAYTEQQKKGFSEVLELFRHAAAADKDLQKAILDFEESEGELKSLQERMDGMGGGATKADMQTIAQEFETVRQMAKMCICRQGNHFPVLCKEYFHNSFREIGSRENIIQVMSQIESIDSEAFCRSYKNQLNRIVPYVVLIPCYGDMGMCWEPFDRYNRATSRGRVAIPMYPKNLSLAVITAVADLRWQVAKEKASYYWMEEGLTGNYYQNFVAKKVRGDVREYFIADYILWITKESDGVQKLEKEVRQIFWRYLPFTQEIKEKLKTRSYVYQELCQKDSNRASSDGY